MKSLNYAPWGFDRLNSSSAALLMALMVGLSIFCASDILASTPFGVYLSIIWFFAGVFFLKRRVFIFILFLTLFGFYEYPRGILDLYDSTTGYAYDVISTVPVMGVPLIYWEVLIASISGVMWSKFQMMERIKSLVWPGVFFVVGLSGLALSYIISGMPLESVRFVKIDVKFPLMIAFGILISNLLSSRWRRMDLISFFYMLPMILGTRAILAVAYDFMSGQINLDLGTRGLFSGIVIAHVLFTGKLGWYEFFPCRVLLYLNLLTSSRGELGLEIMLIGVGLIIGTMRYPQYAVRMGVELMLLLGGALLLVSVTNPRLLDFMYWKASEFIPGTELSGSGKVRIEEIRNIWHLITQKPWTLLFGKGFGAHFRFDQYPFPSNELLDLKSYSEDQIATGNYYGPHSPIGYMLLKFGVVGLMAYILIPVRILFLLWRKINLDNGLFILLVAILGLSYFWRPSEALLMGVFLGLVCNSGLNESRFKVAPEGA